MNYLRIKITNSYMHRKYRFIDPVNNIGHSNIDSNRTLREDASTVKKEYSLDQDIKVALVNSPAFEGSILADGQALKNVPIVDIKPSTADSLDKVTSFSLSINMSNGTVVRENYTMGKDAKGHNVINLIYDENSQKAQLAKLLKTTVLNSLSNQDKTLAVNATVADIQPSNALGIENVRSFNLVYPEDQGFIKVSNFRATRIGDQLTFLPMTNIEDRLRDMVVAAMSESDPNRTAIEQTGEISDIEPASAVQLNKVESFTLSYNSQDQLYSLKYVISRSDDGKVTFVPEENITNSIRAQLKAQYASDPTQVDWVSRADIANIILSDNSTIQGSDKADLSNVDSFTATYNGESRTFRKTEQNGKLFFAVNTVIDDLYQYLKDMPDYAEEAPTPQNSQVTILNPVNAPNLTFDNIQEFKLTFKGTDTIFEASNPPGKPKEFTAKKEEVVSEPNILNKDLKQELLATTWSKVVKDTCAVLDIRPIQAENSEQVKTFRTQLPKRNHIIYFSRQSSDKYANLSLTDAIKQFLTDPQSTLEVSKNPDLIEKATITDIVQNPKGSIYLDSVKSFTLNINDQKIPFKGITTDGTYTIQPSNDKSGNSDGPTQNDDFTREDMKSTEELLKKILRGTGLNVIKWTMPTKA